MDNRIIIDKGEYSSVISGNKKFNIEVSKGGIIEVALSLANGKVSRNRKVEQNGIAVSDEVMGVLKHSLDIMKENIDSFEFLEVDRALSTVTN